MQFVRQNTSEGGINFRNISFLGFMGLVPEQWEKVDHLSYEIERQENQLRQYILVSNLA